MKHERSGSLVLALMAMSLAVSIAGFAFMQYARRATGTGMWSRDHLTLRTLAASAADEALADLQQAANHPDAPAFAALRTPGVADVPDLPGVPAAAARDDAASLTRERGAAVTLTVRASLTHRRAIEGDPAASAGVLEIEAAATLAGRPALEDRVRVVRAYRVARVSPPASLAARALSVDTTARLPVRALATGTPASARAQAGDRTLEDLVDLAPGSGGLAVADTGPTPAEIAAERALDPAVLAAQAHLAFPRAADFFTYIMRARATGTALNGVLHLASPEAVRLDLAAFRGRCLILADGELQAGEISVADPARDALTLVSARRVVVVGARVDACLVSLVGPAASVTFARRARVAGPVLSHDWPLGTGLTGPDYVACAIGWNPALSDPASPGAARGELVVAFAPAPLVTRHLSSPGGWSP